MTKITIEEVRSLARLSALRLDDDEAESLTTDIERILGYFELLSELDTDDVEPTYYGMDRTNIASRDVVAPEEVSREALTNLSEGGTAVYQVKVPKVL